MTKPEHHIFVCGSFRPTGAQGVCHKKESTALLQYMSEEVDDRGLTSVKVSSTGCMNLCDQGLVVVVYPEGRWYKSVTEDVADQILDSIEKGSEVDEEFVLAI